MRAKTIGCVLAALMVHVAAYAVIVVDDAFSGSSLSTEWAKTLTPGAAATVSTGTLTLDINATNNLYRAYIRQQKTEFNFYDVPMTVAVSGLDLRGVAPTAGNAVWFFFGVGDDTNVNQIYPIEAENGRFFAFKRIPSGANQITQVYAVEKINGARTDTYLGNLSTLMPYSVYITMDGNNWSMSVTNVAGGDLGGGYSKTFTGDEADFAAFHFVMGVCNNAIPTEGGSMDIGNVVITSATNEPDTDLLISDAFLGSTLGSEWIAAGAGSTWSATVSNGVVGIDPGILSSGYRAVIARNTDDAGNVTNGTGKVFNFYNRPLNIHSAFGTFGGEAAAGSQVYYSLGICAASNGVVHMYPKSCDNGVFFAVKRLSVGVDQLASISVKDGAYSEAILGNLSGTLTDLDVVLDGNDWALDLTGATLGGLSSVTGTFTSVTEADFAEFYFSAASFNNGTVAQSGTFEIDSLEISAPIVTQTVPAPGLLSSEIVTEGLQISWDAVAAGTYILQSRTNLVEGIWSNAVEGISGIDGVLSITNNFSDPAAFFRVIVQ